MSVRAKFTVSSIELQKHGDEVLKTIKLASVTGPSEENKLFFKWTPCASIQLGVLNPAAADQFEIGAEYYVDFTPAPKS